ncbi:MAG: T9SS type A sorting domain-containing protein [Ferruginibacter sp.]
MINVRRNVLIILISFFFVNQSQGQCSINYLFNPSFENPVQPGIGNNLTGSATFNGWTIPSGAAFNIIKTDGSAYPGGPDNAQDGNQYVDITNAGGFVQQKFSLTCVSTLDYSGYFSRRESGGTGFNSFIEIINSSLAVVATSSVVSFTATESQEVWKQVTGSVTLPAGNYVFRFVMDDYTNIDNAFICATPSCILPVKLSSFTAAVNNCNTKLQWISESEISFKNYQVEYSVNGNEFKNIGEINATNKLTPSTYNYEHTSPLPGKGFYRLKLTDLDGRYQYSKIIALQINCHSNIEFIYPIPTKDVVNINVTNTASSFTSTAVLYNDRGQVVLKKEIRNGTNTIDLQNLSPGMYILTYHDGNKNKAFKIIRE